MFKTGTYWVYVSGNYIDSEYVTNTGSKNDYPYMQINRIVKNAVTDSVYYNKEIYIGVGSAINQLRIWGYNMAGGDEPQVIFEADTPNLGKVVAQGCFFAGIVNMSSQIPHGVSGTPVAYSIDYPNSNKNQEYSYITYYFYPDFGIVQKNERNTPLGDFYWNLLRSHINQ